MEENIGGHLYGLGAGNDLNLDIKIDKHIGKRMAIFDFVKIGTSVHQRTPLEVKAKKQTGRKFL